ncbi:MAG: putative Ig domain-containing protein [Oscillospiraceae bacterium]|jgi:hypothetical protein|nr:putative Ig domain-containing protein [Oscillospiraceae bacterium]
MATLTKRGLKKKVAAVAAVILVLATALGSTLAWRDFSQHKTNEASNKAPRYETVLVENFDEKKDWKTFDGEITKEISVKNTGIASKGFEETYVRIQLKEYMDFTPMIIEYTTDRYMINTDGAYICFSTKAAAQAAYPGAPYSKVNGGYNELTDAVSGVTGWFIPTQEDDHNGQYGKHIVTKYELGAKQFLVGTSAMENARNDANKSISGMHDIKPNGECAYPIHLWDGTDLTQDVTAQPGANDYIKWLLGTEIVMLSDWDGKPAAKWIIDDTAGNANPWIYWGELLLPEQKTANFMEAIELIEQPNGDFYYAIHTEMETVSLDELFGKTSAWPDAPGRITDSWKDNSPKTTVSSVALGWNSTGAAVDFSSYPLQIEIGGSSLTMYFEPTVTGTRLTYGSLNTERTKATGQAAVTYTISTALPAGLSFDYSTGILSGMPAAAVSFEVIAKSKDDPSKYTSIGIVFSLKDWHKDLKHDGTNATIVNSADYILTTAKTGDTSEWMAIARKTVSGNDYYLIIRRTSLGIEKYDAGGNGNDYNYTSLKTKLDTWYAAFTGSNTTSPLVTKAAGHDALTKLGTSYAHTLDGFSTPNATVPTAGAAGTIFPLSVDEAAEYCSWGFWNGNLSQYEYNAAGNQIGGADLQAFTNWKNLTDGTTAPSWLRSPRYIPSNNNGTVLSFDASIGYTYATSTLVLARPAMWVSDAAFN